MTTTVRNATPSLALDAGTIERFLAHSHRRRYPTRTDVFRPGDPAGTLYYVISGSVSIIAEEDDDRELVLGYFGSGEFVGEMGLFIESDTREVILRTRTQCELAEISYERLQQLFQTSLSPDAPRILYAIGVQLSKRLLDTTRKASRLAFLDVTDRIVRTLHDLSKEPEAMSHPQAPSCAYRGRNWQGWWVVRAKWPGACSRSCRPTACCMRVARPSCSTAPAKRLWSRLVQHCTSRSLNCMPHGMRTAAVGPAAPQRAACAPCITSCSPFPAASAGLA
ncbi:cAMP-regulatory protein [Xanthomonas arboricola pv. pruni str. MAFF 311562]|uniref:cAMP-regulatory protein n=1 Tax=Xanthomonas arboricola pv. pruni str. MAFF 311562 TaxID=1414836 RepID=W4S764_9XANT|nr:cAMP-regulatory protein [Xanthomonas arboricola pv. pruni str. MAFF 311562]